MNSKAKTKVPVANSGKSVDKKVKKSKARTDVVVKLSSKTMPSKTKTKSENRVAKSKVEKENKVKGMVSYVPFLVFWFRVRDLGFQVFKVMDMAILRVIGRYL